MRRRRCPRVEPGPVAKLRVPDVSRDRGRELSRAERRAMKESQESLFPGTTDLNLGAEGK
jgi:hypothetical protein